MTVAFVPKRRLSSVLKKNNVKKSPSQNNKYICLGRILREGDRGPDSPEQSQKYRVS